MNLASKAGERLADGATEDSAMFGFLGRRREPEVAFPADLDPGWKGLAQVLAPRFRLQRALGTHWRWQQLLALDTSSRPVVVTVWPPREGPFEEGRQRVVRELRVCSALHHPSIAEILAYGADDEWCWWARPWLEGEKLATRLRGPKIEVELALAWLRQLIGALEAAHQLGIVHRNLKPGCIWVHEQHLMLTDFAQTEETNHDLARVGSGPHLPSPRYLSPEQIMGHSLAPAANYFTLGTIAYQLLTGRTPFPGDDALQVLMQLIQGDLPDVSDLPEHLAQLVEGLWRREAEQRLSDPRQIAHLLRGNTATGEALQELLCDLQNEGRTVSSSSEFTLDPVRAIEKLRNFQFPDKSGALLALGAAAAAWGCTGLVVKGGRGKLSFGYPGARLTLEQLKNLWLYAYSAEHPALSYLALALASSLRQPGCKIRLAGSGWSVLLRGVEEIRPSRSLASHLVISLEGLEDPDWNYLEARLAYCPLPIFWNGKPQPTWTPNQPSPRPGFHLRIDLLERSECTAVVDGLSFALPALGMLPGRVILWGPLQLDATRRQVVRDETLEEVCGVVRNLVILAVERFARLPSVRNQQSELVYREALRHWKERGQLNLVQQFYCGYLERLDDRFNEFDLECWRFVENLAARPARFWELARRRPFFEKLTRNWTVALAVAERISKPAERVLWLLECWLDWRGARPTAAEFGTLLEDISLHRTGAYWDGALAQQLAEQFCQGNNRVSLETRRRWLGLLPTEWKASAYEIRRGDT